MPIIEKTYVLMIGILKYWFMKMNWGTGIFIWIVIFLIGMLSLVIYSSMQPLNLVTPDYYPKSLNYQKKIERMERADSLETPLEIVQGKDYIFIHFPMIDSIHQPQGEIKIFYPRDNHLDHDIQIEVNDSLYQFIPKDGLTKGYCKVKVEWIHDTLDYYVEEDLFVE